MWVWAITIAAIGLAVAGDFLVTRRLRAWTLGVATVLTAVWITAAVAFGGVIWMWRGRDLAGQYFAGYMVEKALSVDNILVFVLLFSSLAVPLELQRRALSCGVVGALVMRGVLILAGGALMESAGWIFYIFGAFVIATGVRMFRHGAGVDVSKNIVVRGLSRLLPVTDDYVGEQLVVRRSGQLMLTPLLVAVVAIESTDLVFALDSIPAVFGVTRDLYIVFVSNAFAVLGLRALYFVVAHSVTRFPTMRVGLAVLLVFIGAKMLVSPVIHVPTWAGLVAIAVVLAVSFAIGVWQSRSARPRERVPSAG
jgi:tellurite resistance protein TerC